MKIGLRPGVLVVAFLTLGMFGVAVEEADATPITFRFAGSVSSVGAPLSSTFSVGQSLTGSYTFESTTLDNDSDPAVGSYPNAVTALSFKIGSYTGGLGLGVGEFNIMNSPVPPVPPGDFYDMTVEPPPADSLSGASVGSFKPHTFNLRLLDDTGSALNTDALPLVPPDLSKFKSPLTPHWSLSFRSSSAGDESVGGPLTSLTLATSVPEPSSLLLLTSGFVGLGLWGGTRRCTSRRMKSVTRIAARAAGVF